MDKSRASRFSPAKRQICKQSGLDVSDGLSEKSKKERLRRLSVLGSEMGSFGSDGEDELRPSTNISKRFKVPRKFWDDCNPVNHSSVPRKLRSAKKKRNLESISKPIPDLEKPKHPINGVEQSRKIGVKKSKMNMQKQGKSNGLLVQASIGPITKDEEEVVETLYALADMFPNNRKIVKTTLEGELSETKSSPLPNEESTMHAIEVAKDKDDSETCRPSTTTEGTNPSLRSEGPVKEVVEIKSLNEPSGPCLVNSKKLHTGLDGSVPQANLRKMSLLSKCESTEEKPFCSSIGFDVQSEMSLWSGLKQPKHEEFQASERKTEVALRPAAALSSQYELQHSFKERKNNESQGAGMQGPSLQSSTDAKLPAWLGNNAASAIQPRVLEIDSTTKMESRVLGGRQKSWKRCTAHVYISHLIKVLKSSERENRLPLNPTLLTTNEGSKQEVLVAANSLNRGRNVNPFGSASEKNSDEVRNAIRLHKRLLQDQQQASASSGICSSQKQSFDFLSLSAGGGGMEANYIDNKATNGLETSTQLHVSYLQPLGHTSMPYSLPQNCYSTTFSDHISEIAARQVQQLPPYLGTPVYGPPHLGINASPKQHQQMIWASHYKPVGDAPQHIPNSQSGRQDSPSLIPYAQTLSPPSRASLEVLGPKYASISLQQQQNLMSMTPPFSSSRLKRQHNNVPFGYEGNGCGFHPDSSLSLQLLCNEQL